MLQSRWQQHLWVIGGLALGGLAGLVIGVLVFWVFPTVQKARSPVAEFTKPPLVLRYLKGSPVAEEIKNLAETVESQWYEVLNTIKISPQVLPTQVHLYLYATPEEMMVGMATRLEEETTISAVADLLVEHPIRGKLGLFISSLVFGPPGNRVVPRGLSLYLDDPHHPWPEEAWTWSDRLPLLEIFNRAHRLLPEDPWEDLYFQLDAPWVGATLTLEKMRTIVGVLSQKNRGGNRVAETYAAALVQWVLYTWGAEGLRSFWQGKGWETAALALRADPRVLQQQFLTFLQEKFLAYPEKERLLALKELHSGHARQAQMLVEHLDDQQAREIKGLAALALGEIEEALHFLGQSAPELEVLVGAPRFFADPVIIIGEVPQGELWLSKARAVLDRTSLVWPNIFDLLPERLTIYLGKAPDISVPWGVMWVKEPSQIPDAVARFVVEAVSPLGLPAFSTLTEGVVLWLVNPERDFRQEAKRVLEAERWVSLTQTLFGVYPKDIAEAEAGGFVRFILEFYGPEKLGLLWEALAEGASIFRAAETVLGLSLYALEAQLRGWAKQP